MARVVSDCNNGANVYDSVYPAFCRLCIIVTLQLRDGT